MPECRFPSLVDQQRFWDRKWDNLRIPNDWSVKRGESILEIVRSLPLSHPRFLDLGCGTGWFTAKLSHLGEAVGIDLSEKAIAIARSQYPGIDFIVGDLFGTSFSENRFDVVVSQEVIAHVVDQVGYLELTASVLRPDGYLVVTTANKLVMERLDWDPQPPEHIEQWLNIRALKRLLSRRFRVLKTTSIIPIGHGGFLRLLNSHKVNRLLEVLISKQTVEVLKERAGFGYTLIALAQKKA